VGRLVGWALAVLGMVATLYRAPVPTVYDALVPIAGAAVALIGLLLVLEET
jgi:hypothetical protein